MNAAKIRLQKMTVGGSLHLAGLGILAD